MSTALVLSPHLDDAVFSCGGTMAVLADRGWRVVMATAFTRSVVPAQGFALACQLDKGLGPEVDYMALRRAEDLVAAETLGVEARWLDLLEAPHRGYGSAAALFGAVLDRDEVWRPLSTLVAGLMAELAPEVVLSPQGLGDHVDHRQMIRAVAQCGADARLAYYRDTPYAMKNPGALPHVAVPRAVESRVDVEAGLNRKVGAACAYATQVGFQFGGPAAAADALRVFAREEGGERFLGRIPLE